MKRKPSRRRIMTKGVIIQEHRRVFFHSNPTPPWICTECDVDMWHREEVAIHHIDEDPSRNCLENLAPLHFGCHTRLHSRRRRVGG
jgi:hypothetical protein